MSSTALRACLAAVVALTLLILTQLPATVQRETRIEPLIIGAEHNNTTIKASYEEYHGPLIVGAEHNNTTAVAAAAVFEEYQGPARAFPVWNHSKKYFPCVPSRDKPIGNLFIGPPKAASSTVGGIMFRISRNVHNRYNHHNNKTCNVNEQLYMYPASKFGYHKRNPRKSFLWSILREPTRRFVSEFFHFEVSRKKVEPTDANMQQYMRKFTYANYLQLLHPEPEYPPMRNITETVEQIIQEYDFIGVVERLDESLVVLKILLGLELNDILYLKAAKGSGGFDDGGYNNSCVYITPSFITPGMKDWFETNHKYKRMTRGDKMIHQAASKSLDLTIDALGRNLVKKELQEFHRAMKVAQETCTNIAYPCSSGGAKTYPNDCIFSDLACGYKCLETLAIE